MNNILITGGESMLGYHTCKLLGANRYYTRHNDSTWIEDSSGMCECDLLNLQQTRIVFDYVKPTHVINYAGFNGNIDFSQKYPADIFFNTSQMALNILKCCQEFGVKKVVNVISSCALPPSTVRQNDDYMLAKTLGPAEYKISKLKAENLHQGPPHPSIEAHGYAKRIWEIYSRQLYKQHGLIAVNVILNNCFGEYDNTDINKTKAVMGIIRRVVDAKKNNLPQIVCWGTGEVYREFLYAKDAAACVLQALDKYNDVECPLNISTKDEITIKELTHKIVDMVGYEGEVVWNTTMPDGQLRKSLDTARMREYIDVKFTNFDTALKNTIDWYIHMDEPLVFPVCYSETYKSSSDNNENLKKINKGN